MGKKVFRIHNEGANSVDWFSSDNINSSVIESIKTDGGNGQSLPTSIPSPFARIDLVRTAFKTLGTTGELDGVTKNGICVATDNHKLVSDALDIGQIFFNFDKHQKDLQLISWSKKDSIEKLLNSGDPNHVHLGKTLELFLKQDSKQYNFNELEEIVILKYKYKVIGGTSPRTLFFASPNQIETSINFGQDTMLDQKLLPLYKREKNYIKYLFALSKQSKFDFYFPELNSYLLKTWEQLRSFNAQLFDELMSMDITTYLESLSPVYFSNNTGHPLSIIENISIKQFKRNIIALAKESDFVIDSIKEDIKPLVLPTEHFAYKLKYTEDFWNPKTEVPYFDPTPVLERTLPEQGDKYPYLTMNDFLADEIIKLPYKIDTSKFVSFGSEDYLLPLKDTFFDYFTTEDLLTKKLLAIKELAGESVEVSLKIPIKKGYISYRKIYHTKQSDDILVSNDKGVIKEASFALAIYPFTKGENIQQQYTIGIANPAYDLNSIGVEIYNDEANKKLKPLTSQKRSQNICETIQTVVSESFDRVKVSLDQFYGMLIPAFVNIEANGGDVYTFSIDLGTTNTHIEYKIEGKGSSKPFDILNNEQQIAFSFPFELSYRSDILGRIKDSQNYLKQEIIPVSIGNDSLYKVPFRTSLLENKNINYNKPSFLFADANIAFDYEKIPLRPYLKSITNLKWSTETNNEKQIAHYIEELLQLCKNKVTVNNGNLKETKVIWFFPVSMTTNHLRKFRNIWVEKFEKVFNKDAENNLSDFPESVAPFYYFKEVESIKHSAKPSVSIDIGGGTTDIMIFENNKPQVISSFNFAGNSIFGNGFNGNINSNGFVQKYKESISKIFEENKLTDEQVIFDRIYNEYQSSSDFINFLFSLIDNQKVIDKHLDLDFNKMLSNDEDFKIIFLTFYSSIIYHIAQLMKMDGYDIPRNIVFSGTGSKTVKILDNSKKLDTLTDVFSKIFEKVYGEEVDQMTLKSTENPKQVTCKGGFYIDSDFTIKHSKLTKINLGAFDKNIIQNKFLDDDSTVFYKDLNDDLYKDVILNVNQFYKFLEEIIRELDLKNEIGLSNNSIEMFNKLKNHDQLDHIINGVQLLKKDTIDTDVIDQTLFFYPIIGLIYEISSELNDLN
ncbi:hypothetical protein FHR24_001573 [Wenyingzhuangia heitensis]|uniref:Uncharacterized protein n=1 Tax=Wenyingzhuangia heitensis TaxID=1487859 RepID=A0ABX0U8H3_9FLAO|nr:hypothetical protein [Wenyingzhuangia heitensis]NIJ45134.1 hypothetical protein [Wenyingzhuangia heitensis]